MDSSMSSITNEGLAIEIKNLSIQVAELKTVIQNNPNTYISHDVFELRMKEIDLQIATIRAQVAKMNSSRWIQNTLSAILGAILSILLAYFFTHIGGH